MVEETPLTKFVSVTLKDIESALPKDYFVAGNVNFDVTVTVQKNKGGKFRIYILSGEAKKSEITTQRISFPVTNRKSTEEGMKTLRRAFQELINSIKELEKPKTKKKQRK